MKNWSNPEVKNLKSTQTQTEAECTCSAAYGILTISNIPISVIDLVNGMKMDVKRQKDIIETISVQFTGIQHMIQNVVAQNILLKTIRVLSFNK